MREATVMELRHRYGDDQLIHAAQEILADYVVGANLLTSPKAARDYVEMRLANEEREHFMVVFLSCQHNVLAAEIMFSGTLTQTSVYPREVVKRALELNAGSVILAHNHPSGMPEPSRADELVTSSLKAALALIDVRVLDHLIVARGSNSVSFAERGLL